MNLGTEILPEKNSTLQLSLRTSLEEAQAGIEIARRNINNLRYADDTTLMAERGTKEPLDESGE